MVQLVNASVNAINDQPWFKRPSGGTASFGAHDNDQDVGQHRVCEAGINESIDAGMIAGNDLIEVLKDISSELLNEDQVADKEAKCYNEQSNSNQPHTSGERYTAATPHLSQSFKF